MQSEKSTKSLTKSSSHVRDNSFQPRIECGDGERDSAALAGSGNRDPLAVDIRASHQVIDAANHIRVRRLIIRALGTVETPGEFVGCVNLPKFGRKSMRVEYRSLGGVRVRALLALPHPRWRTTRPAACNRHDSGLRRRSCTGAVRAGRPLWRQSARRRGAPGYRARMRKYPGPGRVVPPERVRSGFRRRAQRLWPRVREQHGRQRFCILQLFAGALE